MLQEPRRNADGTWRWVPVFRPRVRSERVLARPVSPGPVPYSVKRAAVLVHLACNGHDGRVTFGRA